MLDNIRFDAFSTNAKLGLVMSVLLLVGSLAGCDRDRALAVRHLNKGLKAYERGETIRAVEFLKKAAQADADYAKPHYQAAQIHEIDLDEPKEAERHYRSALDIEPKNSDYSYGLARVLASQGDHEEAIRFFRQTVQNDKKHAKGWFRMGLSQRAMGNNADAVDSFMKSINANARMRMDKDDPGGTHYHALGDLYVEFGFYDKALKVYENGILNNEDSPRLYQGRGVAQLRLQRYQQAAQSFEKALEIDSSHATALFNLAVAHEAMGQPKGAMNALDRFLEIAERAKNRARIAAAQGMIQKLKEKEEEAQKKE